MLNPSQIIDRKSKLFVIILAVMIAILSVPVIIPHILHGYHLVHIGIHVSGITLSVFLSILALIAYRNLKTKRMQFTLIAFLMFVTTEVVTLIDAAWPGIYDFAPGISLSEIGHMLLIATLSMLSIGVFRND